MKQRIRVIKSAPRKREESSLLAQIRLAVGSRPDFLVTRINTGVFSAPGPARTRSGVDPLTGKPWAAQAGKPRYVQSAPPGFPDLIGTQIRRIRAKRVVEGGFMKYETDYWYYYGQAIAIETKSPKGVMSEDQENWRASFEDVGGIYVLARNVADAVVELGNVPPWALDGTRPEKCE